MRPLSASQRESLEEATTTYQKAVTHAAPMLEARGISLELAATFRLGVVSDPHPGHGHVQGMLSIPYLDKDSLPLTLRFRRLQGEGPKYMSLVDDPSRPFNIRAIHEAAAANSDEIHVTEGEFDAIILNSLGLHAIAIPGASLWQPCYRRMLAGFSRVWVWGDPDEAGAEFVNRLSKAMNSAKAVRIRGGDVTEVFMAEGASGILSLVAPSF